MKEIEGNQTFGSESTGFKERMHERRMSILHELIYDQDIPDRRLSIMRRGEEGVSRHQEEFDEVVERVTEIFYSSKTIFPALVEVYSDRSLNMSELEEESEKTGRSIEDIERQRELRSEVMYEAAKKLEMSDYDLEKAHLLAAEEGFQRQTLFDMCVENRNLSLRNLVKLGEELDLLDD